MLAGENPCGCAEHIGRTMLNDVYSTDVETVFRLLFTDSDFIRKFNKAEKTISKTASVVESSFSNYSSAGPRIRKYT